jgi:hypothetical protein
MDTWGITEKSGSLVLLSPLEGTCEVPLRVTFMGRVIGVEINNLQKIQWFYIDRHTYPIGYGRNRRYLQGCSW